MPTPPPAPPRTGMAPALRRFFPLVLLTTLLGGGAAYALSSASEVEYTGTATYLVPPAKTDTAVVTPYDAERIARTYAIVVANDAALLSDLASSLGRRSDAVADRTTTTSLPNSAAVRVTYRGDTRAEVSSYFTALTAALQAPTPPTPNIAAGTVRLLKVDDDVPSSGGRSWLAVAAGAVAGLVLGLAAAAYLDRATPRVRRARDLRPAAGVPAVDVDLGASDSLSALAVRLLDDLDAEEWVAVAAVSSSGVRKAEQLVEGLQRATADLVAGSVLRASAADVPWVPAVLGNGGERATQDARRTLLVAVEKERLEDVALRLSDLYDLGVADVVVTVVHGKAATSRAKPARASRRERRALQQAAPLSDTATR